MITEFLNNDYAAIMQKLIVVSMAWGGVLIAILIDLFFGVQKAKKLNELRSSEGYKRSIEKFVFYYASMFFALLFDALLPISFFFEFPLSAIPFITILAATALILTEFKSVREKAEDKVRRKTEASAMQIIELLKNKEDAFLKLLEQFKKENNENRTDNTPL
ncbi:holin [Chryseobacterium sp. H3056]|uniref:Holin n=1 Tax=Kaistella daneshvariae TaxID=2487074 RepID=A0A3N0WXL9_9FLAO|nr:phage holin family protein [Kaistella daneshvariae]ROI09810.1 holin [Kaistella daneshvariae]